MATQSSSRTMTWQEIVSAAPAPQQQRFGRWEYHAASFTLTLAPDTRNEREIDLDRLTDSAHMLDAIFQVAGMCGVTPQDEADLLRALRAILSPQEHYCSFGRSKEANPRKVAAAAGYIPVE